jgi:transposase
MRRLRKDKITFEEMTASAIEHMAAIGMSQEQIAAVFSISIDTYKRRIKENLDLAASFHKGQNIGLMELQNKAFDLAKEGNVQMLKYILSTKGNWSDKTEVVFNQKSDFETLPKEELEDRLENELTKIVEAVNLVIDKKGKT